MQTTPECKLTVNQQLEAEAARSINPVSFTLTGFVRFQLKSSNYHTGISSRSAHLMYICCYPGTELPRAPGILHLDVGHFS